MVVPCIYVDDSTLIIEGYKLNLTKNDADHGGAISLTKGIIIEIHSKHDIIISHNTAQYYGGGIFIDDAGLWEGTSQHKCFVQRANTSINYTIQFKRNKAEVAGSHLFGGWIDYCYPKNSMQKQLQFEDYEQGSDLSVISSNPSRVCLCTNSVPNCSRLELNAELFPGQMFTVEIVVVGQRLGVIPAIVRAVVRSRNNYYNIVDDLHKLQEGQKKCSTHEFTIQSPNKKERMLLTVDKQNRLLKYTGI